MTDVWQVVVDPRLSGNAETEMKRHVTVGDETRRATSRSFIGLNSSELKPIVADKVWDGLFCPDTWITIFFHDVSRFGLRAGERSEQDVHCVTGQDELRYRSWYSAGLFDPLSRLLQRLCEGFEKFSRS
jgi:hypothetical protein